MALALVNEPQVVFLDEMTTGLDPAARRVAWELVEAIRARGTTVVLVTHFMDEAERLCDRLAIVDRGRVVASGTPQGLIDLHAPQVLVRFTSGAADLDFLYRVPGVEAVTRRGDRVEVAGTGPVLALVAAALVERGIVPSDLRAERATLEDVFLRLTSRPPGRRRRDHPAQDGGRRVEAVPARAAHRGLRPRPAADHPLRARRGVRQHPRPGVLPGRGPMDFYTPAYIGLVLASIGVVSLPAHLAGNRERGVLRRFRASWVPAAVVVGAGGGGEPAHRRWSAGWCWWPAPCCCTTSAGPQSALLLVPAFLLGALAFSAIGVMLGSLIPTARAAQAAGMLLWFVMLFLGGAGPPPEVLTGALQALRHAVPLTYVVGLLQGPWLGRRLGVGRRRHRGRLGRWPPDW